MTKLEETLKCLQRDVEALVEREVQHEREPLYTNNQNRQMMIRYEIFRQTAYAMISDGGFTMAIDMMARVMDELHTYTLVAASLGKAVDPAIFHHEWTAQFSFEEQGWFLDMEEIDEIEISHEDETTFLDLLRSITNPRAKH